MSTKPKIQRVPNIQRLVTRLRDDFKSGGQDFVLLFAYNGTGKTRLSTAFKNKEKKMAKMASDLRVTPYISTPLLKIYFLGTMI